MVSLQRNETNLAAHRNAETGKYNWYAWPGGYQLTYYCHDGDELCPDCANEFDEDLVDVGVNWEGPSTFCAHCNREIESEHGDPDAPEEEKEEKES